MAKDYEEISESEQELIEAMKSPDPDSRVVSGEDEARGEETEAEEKPAKGPKRDETGKFTKAEPEAEAEQPVEGEEKPEGESKYVRLDALHKERSRRKSTEEQLAEMQQQFAQLQQALQQQAQPQQLPQEQQAPEEPPDPVIDKAGYDAYWNKRLEEVQKPYQEFQQTVEQAHRQQQQLGQLKQYATEHEQAFRQQYGDQEYEGALEHMRERTKANLKLLGTPEHQLDQALAQEEMKLTAMAAQRGINPAALVYNMAINNGYTPAQARQQAGDAAERVEKLGQAQKNTKSAAGTAGSAREEDITVERLADMSPDEIAKLPPEKVRAALGG